MEWHTDKRLGTLFGIAILGTLLVFDAGVFLYLRTKPENLLTFLGGLAIVLSLGAMGVVMYWLIGLRRSGYALDRNQLTIFWGATRHVVPTRLIEQIVPGDSVSSRIRFSGGRWPGLWVGSGHVPDLGLTLFNASTSLDQQLFVITDLAAYAISPADREGFVQAFAARKAMGPTQDVLQESFRPAFFDWPLWGDRLARGLTIGAGVLCAALFAYVYMKYPDLPVRIPLHFDAAGVADRFDGKANVFILPVISLLVVSVNTLLGVPIYLRERVAAYLLWGGAILAQALVWVATVTLLA